jgi:outer membrane protein assembly factor BamB/tetratricopeptide (TPR) repeat protein
MSHLVVLSFLLLAFVSVDAANGDERISRASLPGEVAATARRLAAADKLAAQQRWKEAIEEYQRILSEAGDDLVAVSARQAVAARWLCHCRIASLTHEQLEAYRNRVETQAKKWFGQGVANRDGRLLRRIVDEAFCSSYGDRALDLLGDWAFERGDLGAAERWWRMIALPAGEDRPVDSAQAELLFPEPKIDVARVRTKQLIARLFRGEIIDGALASFQEKHAEAHGELAGKQGRYAEILQKLIVELSLKHVDESRAWPTFGGDSGRGRAAAGANVRLARMLFQPPQWRFSLETHMRLESGASHKPPDRPFTNSARNRAMAFNPVILADQAVVADSHSVIAYSLHNGVPSVWFDLSREIAGVNLPPTKLPAPADLRYTLTADEDCLFARLGARDVITDRGGPDNQSYLACLNLKQGDGDSRLRWLATPDETRRGAVFEGAPLVHDGRVYIAATRLEGGQTVTSVHCYPADSEGTGRATWKRDVCITQELRGNARRYRHHLITLAGSRIVYCSHSGAIVALDAETGKNIWAVRYPSRAEAGQAADNSDAAAWERDLAPCVYAAGRIFATPADDNRLFCLDPVNGATIWERRGVDIEHLVGVTRERLIVTTPKSIRAFDPVTGKDIWQMPDVGTFLAPVGRGLLADDLVLWPTSRGLKVLRVDDGRPSSDFPPAVLDDNFPPERLGNMVYADGCLAVAGMYELAIYLAPGRRRAEREAEAQSQAQSARARLDLADAQRDAGLSDKALLNFQQAEKLATSGVLAANARTARHSLLLDLAKSAATRRDWKVAAGHLENASAGEFRPGEQAQALVNLAEMCSRTQDFARAVRVWQSILDSAMLRSTRIEDGSGLPQSAAALAQVQIDRIVNAHGNSLYAPFENLCKNLLDATRSSVREVAAQFPNAAATRAALGEARQRAVQNGGTGGTSGEKEVKGELSLPLARSWEFGLEPSERLLVPSGPVLHSRTSSVVLLAGVLEQGGRLTCRDLSTGAIRWSEVLPFVPSWIAHNSEAVLVGGAAGLARVDVATGWVRWTIPAAPIFGAFYTDGSRLFTLENGQRLLAIDASTGEVLWTRWAPGAGLGLPPPSGRFNSHFFAANDRLLVQSGGGRILILNASTGKTIQEWVGNSRQWMQPPLRLEAKSNRVFMAVQPRRVALLDLDTGKEIWHYDAPHPGTLTGELPQVVGDVQTCLVLIPRNYGTALQRLDSDKGTPRWSEEVRLTNETLAANQVAMDSRAIYYVASNVVHARSLADGHAMWTLPISGPSGPWQMYRLGDALLAAPHCTSEPGEEMLGSLEWTAWLPRKPAAAPASRPMFSLVLVDPQTGQLVQRLNLPSETLANTARKMLTSGEMPNWLLSASRLAISIPGKAFCYVSASDSSE